VKNLPQVPNALVVYTLVDGSDPRSVLLHQLLAQLIICYEMTHVAIIRMMERELVRVDIGCSNDAIYVDLNKI